MPYEIEHKYLLDFHGKTRHEIESLLPSVSKVLISQGWIGRVRLRDTITEHGADSYVCIKFGKGLVRREFECRIPGPLLDILWPFTEGKRINKARYKVKENDLTWEIDIFHGRDLALAEVEVPSKDTKIEIPLWLKPYIVREVTEEKQYTNMAMAR